MARKKWREKNGATSFSSTFSIDFQLAVESNRAENWKLDSIQFESARHSITEIYKLEGE
jgi:hypothetical protein